MKKLFKLFTLIGLLCMVGLNATAATFANTPKVKNIRVREIVDSNNGTSYKIVVVVKHDDADQVAYVEVTVDPIDKSPEPSAKSFTLKPVNNNENRFVSTDLTFKTSALDFEYRVTATMYDEKGNKVGEPETAWVTVDAKGENHEPDACNSKLTMDGATIKSTADEKGNQNIHFDLPLQAKKGNPSVSFYKMTEWTHVAITHSNAKTGYIQTVSVTPRFNEKTGTFEADYSFTNTDKENYWIAEAISGTITNACGDVFYLTGKCRSLPGFYGVDCKITTTPPDTCGKLDLDSVYWEVGAYDKTTGTTPVFVYFPKNHIKNKGNGIVSFDFANTGNEPRISVTNSTNETQNAVMKLNEKTGWYEGLLYFEELASGDAYAIKEIGVTVINACGDKFGFVGNMKKATVSKDRGKCFCNPGFEGEHTEKKNNTDSCNTKFKLKEVDFETATTGGIYTMQFSFNFGNNSDAPNQVVMVAQLTNCKGETVNIKLKMQYNATSGTYYCGQSIPQNKDCEWKLTYAEVGAYNPCKELTWWGLDFSQLKGNGKGTRAATTASNGKPGLL
jgi:hypothetical protein